MIRRDKKNKQKDRKQKNNGKRTQRKKKYKNMAKQNKKKDRKRKHGKSSKKAEKKKNRSKKGNKKRTKKTRNRKRRKKNQSKKGGKNEKMRKRRRKGKKRARKMQRKKGRVNRNSTCLSYTCEENAVSVLKLMKDKVPNLLKQANRVEKKLKQGSGKAGKKGIFASVIHRLIEHGGGNGSALACSGNKTNAGALQMANLTETLLQCEDKIHAACHLDNLPAFNTALVDTC